jgi:uncharacterized membrane protein
MIEYPNYLLNYLLIRCSYEIRMSSTQYSMLTDTPPAESIEISQQGDVWKCGVIYWNKHDNRLCVPKRFGNSKYSRTLNFANPYAIPLMVLLIVVPVVIAVSVSLTVGKSKG